MKTEPCKFIACLLLCILNFATVTRLAAQRVIDIYGPPEAGINLNGNSVFRPFDLAQPARFQQVYDSTAFSSLPSEGGFITGFCFRIDANIGHSFIATIPNLQINLSTTSRAVDGLSAVFSENRGADDTILIGPSAMQLMGLGGGGVTGFGICFDFHENPFYYNPGNGNLLLDFRIYQGIGDVGVPQGVIILDAFDTASDSVSSVYGIGSSSLPTSGQASTLGLATDFIVVPVPEPSSIALLAIGLVMLGGLSWKRMKQRKEHKHVAS